MKTIEERKLKWVDFLENKRRFMFQVDFQGGNVQTPPLWPNKVEERIDYILKNYEFQMNRAIWLDDDFIPNLNMITGTEIFAEAFGSSVIRMEGEMPFAQSFIENASQASKLKVPELSSSSLAYLFDMADRLYKEAGPDAIFRMVDVQSPIDIVSLIWRKDDLYMAFIENPEAVKEVCGKVSQLLTAFLDEWFKRYGKSFIAHYPEYYMPYGITLSEDEVGVVSTDTFNELFLDELVYLSNRYGQMGIHCCATAQHQWESFKKIPNLNIINICQPEQVAKESVKFFADHMAQMPDMYVFGEDWLNPLWYPENARMVIRKSVNTKDEALRLMEIWAQFMD